MGYNKGMARKGSLGAVLVWLVLGVASAQQWLDLRFQDSVSGRALSVEVVLTEQATGRTYAFQSQFDGRLQALLPEGDYVLYATLRAITQSASHLRYAPTPRRTAST
jgi:hypothetical protein